MVVTQDPVLSFSDHVNDIAYTYLEHALHLSVLGIVEGL